MQSYIININIFPYIYIIKKSVYNNIQKSVDKKQKKKTRVGIFCCITFVYLLKKNKSLLGKKKSEKKKKYTTRE